MKLSERFKGWMLVRVPYGNLTCTMRIIDVTNEDLEEIEQLEADAELGALIRKMPEDYCLIHNGADDEPHHIVHPWYVQDGNIQNYFAGTPEEALKKALEEE